MPIVKGQVCASSFTHPFKNNANRNEIIKIDFNL